MKRFLLTALILQAALLALLCSCSTYPPADAPSSKPAVQSSSALPQEPLNPTPLKTVDAAELAAAPAVETIKDLNVSIYLRKVSSKDFLEQPLEETLYNDEFVDCDVIVLNRSTNSAFVVGGCNMAGKSYGTFSVAGDSTLCYNNYKRLAFIDIVKGENTGFLLNFQPPAEPNCRISSLAYDRTKDEYVVLYNVSSYVGSRDWLTYDNSEYGATDAHIEFQRFKGDGSYIDTTVTDLEPSVWNEVASYQPNRYESGRLSFLAKTYIAHYITYDFNTKKTQALPCDGAILLDNSFILYQHMSCDDGTNLFEYTLYENGVPVATSMVKGEENDMFTMNIGNAMYDITLDFYDAQAKTLSVACGNSGTVFHRVNFSSGNGEVIYQYIPEDLEDSVAASKNGRYEIYRIGDFSGGEAYYEELVALDTQTKAVSRIGMINNALRISVTDRGDFVLLYSNRLDVFSLQSSKWAQPLAEFSDYSREYKEGDQVPIDMEYDAENGLFLLMCTAYFPPYTNKFPDGITTENVFLRVYDENWRLLRTIDTKIKSVIDHDVYGPYSTGLELAGNGVALLEGGTVRISYMGN